MEENSSGIHILPDEIVLMILKRTSYADCNSFRRTCKRYNDLLKSSHSLWRVIYRKTVGNVIYNMAASQSEFNWQCDLMQYLSLRDSLIDLIVNMSPKHFREYSKDIGLENVKDIFSIALSSNINYYCTVTILQDFIQTAVKKVNTYETKKPYTLTEIYYGKMILRYLIHVVFTLKWAQNHITDQLTPEIVLNFFTQWLDPVQMHRDEELCELIKDMVRDVDRALLEINDSGRLPGMETHNTCPHGIYSEREVLMAISHYMYKQRRMVMMSACNQDTLDVVKTIKSNSGHGACLGAIFQAMARGFGITSCNLIAFPNHLYLEWRSDRGFRIETLQFSLDKGELRTGGRCPFSANMYPVERVTYKYSADAFIQYIISSFLSHMGDYTGWHTDNAVHLMDFITNNRTSEYNNFILYLFGLDRSKLSLPFNIEYIHEEHINFVHGLLALNKPAVSIQGCKNAQGKDLVVKYHTSALKFSVGLICFHKIYEYACVVRGWDTECAPEFRIRSELAALKHGTQQPFYHVTAVDQSDRYVAQENLILITHPSRIYHLEDAIAKEFSHFNGFFYEPNEEKQHLYPGDMAIGTMYASKIMANMIPEKVRRY